MGRGWSRKTALMWTRELEKVLGDVLDECAEAGSFGREEEDEIEAERIA